MRAQEFLVERVTDAEMVEKIRQMKAQGMTAQQIADQVGLSKSAINAYVLRHNLRPQPTFNQMTGQQQEYILQQFKSGVPLRHLAKQYHISYETISKFLKSRIPANQYKVRALANDPTHLGTTDEQIQSWATEFANGRAITWMAKKYNQTPANVRYWLEKLPNWAELVQSNRLNRKTKVGNYAPKGITADDIQKMAQMFITGQPYTSIGKQFNIDKGLVGKYLKRLPNFVELQQQHLNLRPTQFGGRQKTTRAMNAKPYTKGIHAVGRVGPNIR